MKKAVAVAAAGLMAATAVTALAGCTDKEHTIRVLLLTNATETSVYRQYFKDLEKELKEDGLEYKIDYTGLEEGDYYNRLKSDVQRGDIPDIFYLRPNEILQYKDSIANLQSYADNQDIADLSDIYESALDMYRYNPTTGELGNPDDDLYAFPKDLSTQQLGYNKTQLAMYEQKIKAAGYKMPWELGANETYTWTQYKEINKIIADNKESNTFAACDVPSVEILAKSFGGSLIDLDGGRANGTVSSLTQGAVYEAIKYQADLVDCGAADYTLATYANFAAGRVCFYGLVASWEVAEYNELIGDGNWGVMPWPTQDGGAGWYGLIKSAGYVVSQSCVDLGEKGDVAKRIAVSFLSNRTQERFVKDEKITLPLRKSVADDYKDSANDANYKPATRGIFLDVISGAHGIFPAEYSTYDKVWLDELSTALEVVWNEGKGKANAKFTSTDWESTQSRMQTLYNESKNK